MNNNSSGKKYVKMSDCHHGTYREDTLNVISGASSNGEAKIPTGNFICNICNQQCKIIEMLVDER